MTPMGKSARYLAELPGAGSVRHWLFSGFRLMVLNIEYKSDFLPREEHFPPPSSEIYINTNISTESLYLHHMI